MDIAVVSYDIREADPRANLEYIDRKLSQMPVRPDIVALPELFSTGFITDRLLAGKFAEGDDGSTMAILRRMAEGYGCAFAGSYLHAAESGATTNRGFIMLPDGREIFYDKRHLFSLSQESRLSEQGAQLPPVISYKGLNLSIIVCYDLRFPAWCRNVGMRYDVLFVPANWPDVREYAWRHLLIARAIENQCVTVGANRGGEDRFGKYDNTSCIFDEMGRPIGSTAASGVVRATVTKSKIEEYRRKFPVVNDADSFSIDI